MLMVIISIGEGPVNTSTNTANMILVIASGHKATNESRTQGYRFNYPGNRMARQVETSPNPKIPMVTPFR